MMIYDRWRFWWENIAKIVNKYPQDPADKVPSREPCKNFNKNPKKKYSKCRKSQDFPPSLNGRRCLSLLSPIARITSIIVFNDRPGNKEPFSLRELASGPYRTVDETSSMRSRTAYSEMAAAASIHRIAGHKGRSLRLIRSIVSRRTVVKFIRPLSPIKLELLTDPERRSISVDPIATFSLFVFQFH